VERHFRGCCCNRNIAAIRKIGGLKPFAGERTHSLQFLTYIGNVPAHMGLITRDKSGDPHSRVLCKEPKELSGRMAARTDHGNLYLFDGG